MLIMHIGHISRTQSLQQNRHMIFHALVALKLLVSLISRLVACSARIVVDRQTNRQTDKQTNRQTDKQTNRQTDKQTNRQTDKQTNRQTDKHTDTQTKYRNPRCACAPRVNYCLSIELDPVSHLQELFSLLLLQLPVII